MTGADDNARADGDRAGIEGERLRVALVGSWLLERWAIEHPATARTTEPFGADAEGLLIYAADGWMSVAMQRRGRAAISLSSHETTTDDRAAAFGAYMHYAGRWHVEGRDVVHEIRIAMHPGLLRTTQRRRTTLAGKTLELCGDEVYDARGNVRRHRVVWKRAR
jgi:lipocalin-like protein